MIFFYKKEGEKIELVSRPGKDNICILQFTKNELCFFFRGNAEVRQSLHQAKVRLKQSKRKDYYKILGVERGANDDEIKKAYKKRALATHPGRNHCTSQIHSRTVKTTLEPSGTVPFFCHSFCNQTLHIKKSKS